MMTRFGTIDMKEGNIDRGRTIFEGLVAKFPKRGDIWSVYVDMERLVMNRSKVASCFVFHLEVSFAFVLLLLLSLSLVKIKKEN